MLEVFQNLLFRAHSMREVILKNALWLAIGEISGRLIRAILVIYAARVLGAEGFGILAYALSIAALFTVISELGLGAILTREASRDPERSLEYFQTTFVIKVSLTIVSAFILVIGLPYITSIKFSSILIISIALLFIADTIRSFLMSIYRASEKMEYETFFNIVTQVGILSVGLILLNIYRTPESLAFAYAIGSIIGTLGAIYNLRKYFLTFFKKIDFVLARHLFKAAWLFSIGGILGVVMLNTDIIMIGALLDATSVGLYSAAQKPIMLLYVLPAILCASFFPSFARYAILDKIKFKIIFEKAISLSFFMALPSAIFIILNAKAIINIIYGNGFELGTHSFQILSLTLFTTYPVYFITNAIFALNREKDLLIFGIGSALLNAILDYFFIIKFGFTGSAIATLITQLMASIFMWHRLSYQIHFKIFSNIKIMILAAAMAGILQIMLINFNMNIILLALLFLITYLIILIIFKEKILIEAKNLLLRKKIS